MSYNTRLNKAIKTREEFYKRVKEICSQFIPYATQTNSNEKDDGRPGRTITAMFEYGSLNEKGADIPGVAEIKTKPVNKNDYKLFVCGFTNYTDDTLGLLDAERKLRHGLAFIEYEYAQETQTVTHKLGITKTHTYDGVRIKRVTMYDDLDISAFHEYAKPRKKDGKTKEVFISDFRKIFKTTNIILEDND